jgi:hypothetical protein
MLAIEYEPRIVDIRTLNRISSTASGSSTDFKEVLFEKHNEIHHCSLANEVYCPLAAQNVFPFPTPCAQTASA